MLLTFEPGDTPSAATSARIVLDPATGDLADRTEALLYAADKAEHVETVVRPALERGKVVITDRYVDCSLAYQGAGRAIDAAELERVLRWATGDLRPHLTVLLDVEPSAGLGRFDGPRPDRGGVAGVPPAGARGFLAGGADPDHYLVLDARADRDEIAAPIRDRVKALLQAGAT